MAEFKVVISDPKTGLTVQREVKDPAAKALLGLKIGDSVKGEAFDLQGYDLEITGGSDFCGFPMRKDVIGIGRKKILSYTGVGVRKGPAGMLQRKTVCGNTIHTKIAQVNLKAIKVGGSDIFADVKAKSEKTKAERVAKTQVDSSRLGPGAKTPREAGEAPKAEAPVAATA